MSAPSRLREDDGQGILIPDRYLPQRKARRIETAWMGRCPECETVWMSVTDERDFCPVHPVKLDRLACLACGSVDALTREQLCVGCSIETEEA